MISYLVSLWNSWSLLGAKSIWHEEILAFDLYVNTNVPILISPRLPGLFILFISPQPLCFTCYLFLHGLCNYPSNFCVFFSYSSSHVAIVCIDMNTRHFLSLILAMIVEEKLNIELGLCFNGGK